MGPKLASIGSNFTPSNYHFLFFTPVDPVRLSVNALASSLISFSKVPRYVWFHEKKNCYYFIQFCAISRFIFYTFRSTSLHNSLPDLASPDQEDHVVHQQQRQPALLLNSNRGNNSSQLEASAGINSKSSGGKGVRPPPLPPKSKSQSQSDESIDPLSSEAMTANIGKINYYYIKIAKTLPKNSLLYLFPLFFIDWFSNPLFESNVQRR